MPALTRPARAVVAVALLGALTCLVVLLLPLLAPGPHSGPASAGETEDGSVRGCGPPSPDDVRGRRPDYLPDRITPFWSAGSVCQGMWLSGARGRFVPQGVAVAGDTAWVSGYQSRTMRQRPCRVLEVDLRSLRVVRSQSLFEGAVPGREPTYCRHGGAIVLDAQGRLLLVETMRLWLLDPDRLGTRDAVLRVWRIPDGVKGSVAVVTPSGELGLGTFTKSGPARIHWIDLAQLDDPGRAELTPDRTTRAPAGLQGLAWGSLRPGRPAGLWSAVSHSRCGALLGPQRQRLAVAPGVEGFAFTDDSVWAVSEASVRIYHDPGDPVVPQLLRYDRSDLAATAGSRSRALARQCSS